MKGVKWMNKEVALNEDYEDTDGYEWIFTWNQENRIQGTILAKFFSTKQQFIGKSFHLECKGNEVDSVLVLPLKD